MQVELAEPPVTTAHMYSSCSPSYEEEAMGVGGWGAAVQVTSRYHLC